MTRRRPAIVIHGGAGSISRAGIPPDSPAYKAYVGSLHKIVQTVHAELVEGASALDAATHAVQLFEDNALFNAGKGAVFTRAGRNELEASVMVTRGAQKRGVGVQMLTRVKNPILLAKELLLRGPDQGVPHNCLSGQEAERLAGEWGLQLVDESYFFTERRWNEHLKGLEKITAQERESGARDGFGTLAEPVDEYLPQGTVGCVAMDVRGVIVAATSTGGMTNKFAGRIGDTPTLGTGFWAEEWEAPPSAPAASRPLLPAVLSAAAACLASCCAPSSSSRSSQHGDGPAACDEKACIASEPLAQQLEIPEPGTRAVGLSGTGNGDYFLRLGAAHSIAARCRFGGMSLKDAMREMQGVGGEMQRAAGNRWGKGDGEGGFIGIDEMGNVVMDMNSGGMFRGTVDEHGRSLAAVYRDEDLTYEAYRDEETA